MNAWTTYPGNRWLRLISKEGPLENKLDVKRFTLIVVWNATSRFSLWIPIEILSFANTSVPTYKGHNVEAFILLRC